MEYTRPKLLYYRIAQIVSWFVATFVFKRKFIRNEIKGKRGAYVVIANHEAAYDFVNLISASARTMSFVISNSFFNTLPVKGFMQKMGVIPKQQFQTSIKDLKRIKAVIDHGEPVVIYPAGLMCEDGLSTPIPAATYKFLKWLNTDVYIARTSDEYAFLHNHRGIGKELRYVSDWSKLIYETLKEKIKQGHESILSAKTKIHMIDYDKCKFVEVGHGILSLSKEHFLIDGQINEQAVNLSIPTANFPTLPFGPGKYLEIQHGSDIYRCVLDDGRLAMKFINMVKIFHELRTETIH